MDLDVIFCISELGLLVINILVTVILYEKFRDLKLITQSRIKNLEMLIESHQVQISQQNEKFRLLKRELDHAKAQGAFKVFHGRMDGKG